MGLANQNLWRRINSFATLHLCIKSELKEQQSHKVGIVKSIESDLVSLQWDKQWVACTKPELTCLRLKFSDPSALVKK